MLRVAAGSVALVAAVVVAAALAPPAPSAAAPCTRATAKRLILASPALRALRDTLTQGGGVSRLICRDLTRDGKGDMAVTIFSGGTAGDIAWVVFRRVGGSWRLAHRRLRGYKLALVHVRGDLVETMPVYRDGDPNCCPSGGFDHRRFHWNGTRFVVVRSWHDTRPGP